jgi:hypothetical protein
MEGDDGEVNWWVDIMDQFTDLSMTRPLSFILMA